MAIKDKDRKARANYAKKCRQVLIVLYPTDQDIADYIDSTDEPTATLIKRLIREEIVKRKTEDNE